MTSATFNDELNDRESQTYKTLASKIERSLKDLFESEGLELESVKVLGFRKGSVIVDFYVVTLQSMDYQTGNVTVALSQAVTNGRDLDGETFGFDPNDFSMRQVEPTIATTIANEANKGLQKNEEEDDSAMVVVIVICVLLVLGIALVAFYVAKKKNFFKRSKRKVVPEE